MHKEALRVVGKRWLFVSTLLVIYHLITVLAYFLNFEFFQTSSGYTYLLTPIILGIVSIIYFREGIDEDKDLNIMTKKALFKTTFALVILTVVNLILGPVNG